MAPFQLGIWTGPFPVGDMDWPLSGWGYGLAPFRLGIWTPPRTDVLPKTYVLFIVLTVFLGPRPGALPLGEHINV